MCFQEAADEFYSAFNGQRYNSLESDVCSLVYVSKVETCKESEFYPMASHTELPLCSICLESEQKFVKIVHYSCTVLFLLFLKGWTSPSRPCSQSCATTPSTVRAWRSGKTSLAPCVDMYRRQKSRRSRGARSAALRKICGFALFVAMWDAEGTQRILPSIIISVTPKKFFKCLGTLAATPTPTSPRRTTATRWS